jgi:hypothetical protein
MIKDIESKLLFSLFIFSFIFLIFSDFINKYLRLNLSPNNFTRVSKLKEQHYITFAIIFIINFIALRDVKETLIYSILVFGLLQIVKFEINVNKNENQETFDDLPAPSTLNEPARQTVALLSVLDAIKNYTPNIRRTANITTIPVPSDLEQQMRTVDFCNLDKNLGHPLCRWYNRLTNDPAIPAVNPSTKKEMLNKIFRNEGFTVNEMKNKQDNDILENYRKSLDDMKCDSCTTCEFPLKQTELSPNLLGYSKTESSGEATYAPFKGN